MNRIRRAHEGDGLGTFTFEREAKGERTLSHERPGRAQHENDDGQGAGSAGTNCDVSDGANCCVSDGADGGAKSYRLLTHSEPPSGSLVTGFIGRELRRGEDSVRNGSGAMGRGAQSGGTKVLRMRLHRNGATGNRAAIFRYATNYMCGEKENAIRRSESRF